MRTLFFLIIMGAMPFLCVGQEGNESSDPDIRYLGTSFTIPYDDDSSHNNLLINLVNNAPKGSAIHFDVYKFDDDDITSALVDANQRGVAVHVLVHQDNKHETAFKTLAGGLHKPASLYYGQAGHAGSGRVKPVFDHNKLFLFSKTEFEKKTVQDIVVVSSGNLTKEAKERHQATIIVSSKEYYSECLKYWHAQRAFLPLRGRRVDAYKRTWPRAGTARGYANRIYFFPKVGGNDPLCNTLKPASMGVGLYPNHRTAMNRVTKIRIAVANWYNSKTDIATVLSSLVRGGNCEVEIIGRTLEREKRIHKRVLDTLCSRLDATQLRDRIKIYWLEMDNETFAHSKYMLVEGPWGNPIYTDDQRKIQWREFVFHGTRNWTNSGLRTQDNIALKISDRPTYRAFLENFNMLKELANAPGSIEVLTRASTPSKPWNDRRILFTGVALGLYFAVGGGIVFMQRPRVGGGN